MKEEDIKSVIEIYQSEGYTKEQLMFIKMACKAHFNKLERSILAGNLEDEKMNWQIYKGLANGLTTSEVNFYANSKLDESQMEVVRKSFEQGLTVEQISTFAKPEIKAIDMDIISAGMIYNFPKECIDYYLKEGRFDLWQKQYIAGGIEKGFTLQQMAVLADPKLCGDDYEIRHMNIVCESFEKGLSIPQVKCIIEMGYPEENKMQRIQDDFIKYHLTIQEVALYNNENFNEFQQNEIREALINHLTDDQLQVLMNPKFDYGQMQEIRYGFQDGLSVEQVSKYAKPNLANWVMELARVSLVKNYTKEQVENIIKAPYSKNYSKSIYRIVMTNGGNQEILDYLTNNKDRTFNNDQLHVIKGGLLEIENNKLTLDDVLFYADPKFNKYQMKEIRDALEKGVSREHAQILKNSSFSNFEMELIKNYMISEKEIPNWFEKKQEEVPHKEVSQETNKRTTSIQDMMKSSSVKKSTNTTKTQTVKKQIKR